MSIFFHRLFSQNTMLRTFFLGATGAITLAFPGFLFGPVVYALAAYAMLSGALRILRAFNAAYEKRGPSGDLSLPIGILLLLFGILSIAYHRRLVSGLPVYLGALALAQGAAYLVVARLASKTLRKVLALLALCVGAGGIVVVCLTFGSLQTLSRVYGSLMLAACGYELLLRRMPVECVK